MTTDQTTLAPSSAPPALAAFLDEIREVVDRELAHRLAPPADDPCRLAEAISYAATGPGKRLRPALVLAAAEACGGTRASAMPAAVALEMLHAYTLVHDDLPAMDNDTLRRGRPTVHVAYGEAIAILAGDGLLTHAFGTLAELGPRAADAVRVLATRAGARELLAGQAIDLAVAGRLPSAAADDQTADLPLETPPDLDAIERMHAAKTGALFAAAAELGGIAAGATPEACAALARYGLAIGIAFQHADDRDDAELVSLATVASRRMKELCASARSELPSLGRNVQLLDAIALWIMSRA